VLKVSLRVIENVVFLVNVKLVVIKMSFDHHKIYDGGGILFFINIHKVIENF
jgi:hypothetical protein